MEVLLKPEEFRWNVHALMSMHGNCEIVHQQWACLEGRLGMQGVTHAKTFQQMHSKYEQGQERVPGREGEAAAASEAALAAARRRRDARAMDKGKLAICQIPYLNLCSQHPLLLHALLSCSPQM